MKHIILLIVAFISFATCKAVDPPTPLTVSASETISTFVKHHCIQVTNCFNQGWPIPELYKGEKLTLHNDGHYYDHHGHCATDPNRVVEIYFILIKDWGYEAHINMEVPGYPVNGVKLEGEWKYSSMFEIPDPNNFTGLNKQYTTFPNGLQWTEDPSYLVLTFIIKEIDAQSGGTAVITGIADFEITITADYGLL